MDISSELLTLCFSGLEAEIPIILSISFSLFILLYLDIFYHFQVHFLELGTSLLFHSFSCLNREKKI